MDQASEMTQHNTGMVLNIAFNYGSRLEILDAVSAIASDVRDGKIGLEAITEEFFSDRLYTKGVPDPDLLITGQDYPSPALAQGVLTHPATRALAAGRANIADNLWVCGTPLAARAVATLRAARPR